MVKMLGSIFSGSKSSTADEIDLSEPVISHPKEEPTKELVEDKPAVKEPVVDETVEEEPLIAVKQETAPAESATSILAKLSSADNEPPKERQVNEDSLLPSKPEPVEEPLPAPENKGLSNQASVDSVGDPVLARLSELKQGLKEREQKKSGEVAVKADDLHAGQKLLTDPVVLGPGDASQDQGSMSLPSLSTGLKIPGDEPSEADHFKEGKIPSFLKGDELLDEASDGLSAQSWAKRLSPNSDKK